MALFAFDGTWNREHDAGEYGLNTNVVRFRDAYNGPDLFYTKGVGTRIGWFGKLVGGAFGAGGKSRVQNAYNDLCDAWIEGDHQIDIIGFSRGAALALDFTNRIADRGIRHPNTGEKIEPNPIIRFLGLWDVVAAFGIPIDLGFEFQRINLGHKLTLPKNVQHAFHAMALDERRQAFRVTRVKNAYEVWFRGFHSDIGGGNGNLALNFITLRWMFCKALASGLPIRASAIGDIQRQIDKDAALSPPFDVIENKFREVMKQDRYHYTVSDRPDCNKVPSTCAMETVDDEKSGVELPTAKAALA